MTNIYIIAEIASAHEGEIELAKRLVDLAASTGADAVKLQLFQRDQLLSRFHPKYDSFGEIEIEQNGWLDVLNTARQAGPEVILEVYDEPSLIFAEEWGGAAGYKIPTSDLSNSPFVRRVAETGRRVYLGVGGATRNEIEFAVGVLRECGVSNAVLLHGLQSFPTLLEDSLLAEIPWLKATYGYEVGYADHVDAEDKEWAHWLPAMAVAAGATTIEKHITDARSRKGRDYYSSLNPDEFSHFVRRMKQLPLVMQQAPEDELSEAQNNYRILMKRQAVAVSDLGVGELLRAGHVVFKRTNRSGISPQEMEHHYGKRVCRQIQSDEPLSAEDFE